MTTDKALLGSTGDFQIEDPQDQGLPINHCVTLPCSLPSSPPMEWGALLIARHVAEQNRVATAHFLRLATPTAAKYIGACPRALAYWRENTIGPPYQRIGSKVWYVLPILDAWIAQQPAERFKASTEARCWSQEQLAAFNAETCASQFTQPAAGNLTRKQTALFLGISLRLLDSWRGQLGQPQPVDNGTNLVRYSIADLDAWLKANFHHA